MKKFTLDEYHKDTTRKIVTAAGDKVRIICTKARTQNFPVVALIATPEGKEKV